MYYPKIRVYCLQRQCVWLILIALFIRGLLVQRLINTQVVLLSQMPLLYYYKCDNDTFLVLNLQTTVTITMATECG